MNNLIKTLAKQAKRNGICEQWLSELKTLEDRRELVKMYLRGIDFCLRNNYPSNEFIKEHFGDICPEMGVFVDKHINVSNVRPCVCLGVTFGKYEITEYSAGELYVKHNAEIDVTAKDNAFLMISVFDNAIINIHAHDRAKVCVNRFGGKVNIIENDFDAMVKVNERNPNEF
ncbi:MAG: hypothetical protein NC110_00285 [Ruminococcus sp.]|nr:hypothetical protein [Ruminococcus sp.]MCM1543714.1 hypothetical protein [Ruminococcus sp.]